MREGRKEEKGREGKGREGKRGGEGRKGKEGRKMDLHILMWNGLQSVFYS